MTSERFENFIFYLHEISIPKSEISVERIGHTLPILVKTKQIINKNEHKTKQKQNAFSELFFYAEIFSIFFFSGITSLIWMNKGSKLGLKLNFFILQIYLWEKFKHYKKNVLLKNMKFWVSQWCNCSIWTIDVRVVALYEVVCGTMFIFIVFFFQFNLLSKC